MFKKALPFLAFGAFFYFMTGYSEWIFFAFPFIFGFGMLAAVYADVVFIQNVNNQEPLYGEITEFASEVKRDPDNSDNYTNFNLVLNVLLPTGESKPLVVSVYRFRKPVIGSNVRILRDPHDFLKSTVIYDRPVLIACLRITWFLGTLLLICYQICDAAWRAKLMHLIHSI